MSCATATGLIEAQGSAQQNYYWYVMCPFDFLTWTSYIASREYIPLSREFKAHLLTRARFRIMKITMKNRGWWYIRRSTQIAYY